MDVSEWIGTRWRARCNMVLPKGSLAVGDTFTFDARCAAFGLRPDQWLAAGNAERLDAGDAPLSAIVAERAVSPPRGLKGGRGRPEPEPLPDPVVDGEGAADPNLPLPKPGPTPWVSEGAA